MIERIHALSAVELIQFMAYDTHPEDLEASKSQRDDYAKMCRLWLSTHVEDVNDNMKTREVEIMRRRSELLVIALCGKEIAPKWWTSRNRALNMETPDEVWAKDPSQVYKYLMSQSDYFI